MKRAWKELWGPLRFTVRILWKDPGNDISICGPSAETVWSSREDVGAKLKSDLRVLIGFAFFVVNTYTVVFSDQSKLARIRPSALKLVRSERRGAEVRQQKVDLIIPVCDKLNPE